MVNSFSIVVDSSCDLPVEYIKEHDIRVIPMPFSLNSEDHEQGYWQRISGRDFYEALRQGGMVQTSQITPKVFIDFFTPYAEKGEDVLFLVLSGELSNTYQSAKTALEEVRQNYPYCNIYLVDSITATTGHGLLAMLAAKKRKEGLSVAQVASWLEKKKHTCFGYFTVDDLMYLHRGGRLSKLSAIAGAVLGIKPVLNLTPSGALHLGDKVRGRKAACKLIIDHFLQSINPDEILDTVLITHTDCSEAADAFANMVKETGRVHEVICMLMGPVIGAHLGPGALTLVFEAGLSRQEYADKFAVKK